MSNLTISITPSCPMGRTPTPSSGLDIRYMTISDGFSLGFDRGVNLVEYWESMFLNFPDRGREDRNNELRWEGGAGDGLSLDRWLAVYLAGDAQACECVLLDGTSTRVLDMLSLGPCQRKWTLAGQRYILINRVHYYIVVIIGGGNRNRFFNFF